MQRIFYLICIVLCVGSCLDPLELEVPKNLENGLAIQGELIKGEPSIIRISVGNIFNFDAKTLFNPQLESVLLFDEEGNVMNIPSVKYGLYQHVFDPNKDPIQIEYYQKYKIRVETTDDRTFESSLEILMPLPEGKAELTIEQTYFLRINENGALRELPAVQFAINSPLALDKESKNARFLFTAKRTCQLTDGLRLPGFVPKTCYITVNLDFDKIHMLDGTSLEADEVEEFKLSKILLNHEFAEGYLYTVYRKSLNASAFTYWGQNKQTIERGGLLFEPIIGRIQSNFTNISDIKDSSVFGYFTAYTQDTLQLFIPPEQYKLRRYCPLPERDRSCYNACCDCLGENGSSLEKPANWGN